MGWKKKILDVLAEKPLVVSVLIDRLGFSLESTGMDASTRYVGGLKPLHGSFLDSTAQHVLGRMVRLGDVHYRRASNLSNWYGLPGQPWPRSSRPRKRTLDRLLKEVFSFLPAVAIAVIDAPSEIGEADMWVEFCPFVLLMTEDGWELADGDPICNWCSNTFTKKYPMDVDPKVIARKIVLELKKQKLRGD